jgi:hypothetical protein
VDLMIGFGLDRNEMCLGTISCRISKMFINSERRSHTSQAPHHRPMPVVLRPGVLEWLDEPHNPTFPLCSCNACAACVSASGRFSSPALQVRKPSVRIRVFSFMPRRGNKMWVLDYYAYPYRKVLVVSILPLFSGVQRHQKSRSSRSLVEQTPHDKLQGLIRACGRRLSKSPVTDRTDGRKCRTSSVICTAGL